MKQRTRSVRDFAEYVAGVMSMSRGGHTDDTAIRTAANDLIDSLSREGYDVRNLENANQQALVASIRRQMRKEDVTDSMNYDDYLRVRGNPARRVRRNPAPARQKSLFGVAAYTIRLLGTGLYITKGERFHAEPATNLPNGGWFVRPANPETSDSWSFRQGGGDDSIHVGEQEMLRFSGG